jgi:hypothetical protein
LPEEESAMMKMLALVLGGLWEALAGVFPGSSTVDESGDRGQQMDPNG